MATDRYIAALEISSSKVIGAVGAAGKSGQLEILAIEQEKSSDSVRYGQIQNIEETYNLISYVLERLERRQNIAPREIAGVYVGISGRSLRNIRKEVSLALPDDTEITDAILERLKRTAMDADIDNSLEIIDAIPRIFIVGKEETHRPKGRLCNNITAIYDLIVARPIIQNYIKKVVKDRLDLDLKGVVVTALAVGDIALNEHEKEVGCMLVDIGAETTTVCIFRNGALNYFSTLPFGGRNITRDITSLSLLEERAEEIKITSGNALAPEVPSSLNLNGVKLSEVSNLVVARSEEIVANIAEQIAYAGLKEKDLPGGVICIGGGAKLNGMSELISRQLGLPVKTGRLPSFVHIEDVKGPSTEIIEASSVLYAGSSHTDEVCLETPRKEDLPTIGSAPEVEMEKKEPEPGGNVDNPNSWKNKIKSGLARLFTNPEEDDDEKGMF